MNTPFHLDQAIARWRNELNQSGSIGSADLAELETHLRDSFEELRTRGLTDDEAFHIARRRLGGAEIVEEFAKVDPDAVWAGHARWMIFGVLVSQIFWSGSKMVMAVAGIVTASGFSASGQAMMWSQCAGMALTLAVFAWVLIRLVRGKWRLGNSRQVAFFLHPAALAVMLCLLTLLQSAAVAISARTLGVSVFAGQAQVMFYLGLAMTVGTPPILAIALTMAQRRVCQG